MEPVPVRFHHNGLTGPVAEGPVQRWDGTQQREVQQSEFLPEGVDHLRHSGALSQKMVDQDRRLDRRSTGAGKAFIAGKLPIVELSAHQALVVDPLVEQR